ncbi:hypothetical protein EYF80_047518 [Liparis tanakae]|uniref:Uncharacterized protein n=1 Tax=Liparis tanakae TaxID=230148 RepID=A0A4Z2FN35_9TELE|nr:hypothetical protein EYF80_047518 [Liparis tanakae]
MIAKCDTEMQHLTKTSRAAKELLKRCSLRQGKREERNGGRASCSVMLGILKLGTPQMVENRLPDAHVAAGGTEVIQRTDPYTVSQAKLRRSPAGGVTSLWQNVPPPVSGIALLVGSRMAMNPQGEVYFLDTDWISAELHGLHIPSIRVLLRHGVSIRHVIPVVTRSPGSMLVCLVKIPEVNSSATTLEPCRWSTASVLQRTTGSPGGNALFIGSEKASEM